MVTKDVVTMKLAVEKGGAVDIGGVIYWAGEDLAEGQLVGICSDRLVRGVAVVGVDPHGRMAAEREDPEQLFPDLYISETQAILDVLECDKIDLMAHHLAIAKTIYVVGHGGSAATASHAANDLRKLCGKNAICPTDNTSLMTALANDYSFDAWLEQWFKLHPYGIDDHPVALFLSVGGGNGKTSAALTEAARMLYAIGDVRILAIVGRDGGELAKLANCAVVIPNLFPERVTPHVEGLASVLLHLLVSHPALAKNPPTWRT